MTSQDLATAYSLIIDKESIKNAPLTLVISNPVVFSSTSMMININRINLPSSLIMRTEMVLKMFVYSLFYHLTWLVARECFTKSYANFTHLPGSHFMSHMSILLLFYYLNIQSTNFPKCVPIKL